MAQPAEAEPRSLPQHPSVGELFALLERYLADIEARTGTAGYRMSEAEFRSLWADMSDSERQQLETILQQPFASLADQLWPEAKAVIDDFEKGHHDPELLEEIQQLIV